MSNITPKPTELIKNIIMHTTNEDDVVLDCFAGSGTTGVAAAQLNRRFILIEKEEEYMAIIDKRLRDEV